MKNEKAAGPKLGPCLSCVMHMIISFLVSGYTTGRHSLSHRYLVQSVRKVEGLVWQLSL